MLRKLLHLFQAFEVLPFHVQIKYLFKYGIKGRALKFVNAWLIDRKQRTKIQGTFSSLSAITSGCVQGSKLGPFMFVQTCIKELAKLTDEAVGSKIAELELNSQKVVANRLKMCSYHFEYADDIAQMVLNRLEDLHLNDDVILPKYEKWITDNFMAWNTNKTELHALGPIPEEVKFIFAGAQVEISKYVKYLGVTFESKNRGIIDLKHECGIRLAKYTLLVNRTPKNLKKASFKTLSFIHGVYLQTILLNCSQLTGVHRRQHYKNEILNNFKRYFSNAKVPKSYQLEDIPLTPIQSATLYDYKLAFQIIKGKNYLKVDDLGLYFKSGETFDANNEKVEKNLLETKRNITIAAWSYSFNYFMKTFWNCLTLEHQNIATLTEFVKFVKIEVLPLDHESQEARNEIFSGEAAAKRKRHLNYKKIARQDKQNKLNAERISKSILAQILQNVGI